MKGKTYLIGLLVSIVVLMLVISCGISSEDLAKQVQENYISQWNEAGVEITITKDLVLVKKNKTEYTGLMTLSLDGETEQVTVNVVFDGKTFTSQIEGW